MAGSVVFEYFTKEEIRMPYEDAMQEQRAWEKYLLVLIQMKEQMLADSISFEEAQNEYLFMESFMEMRNVLTKNRNPDKENYAFLTMEKLELNEAEKAAFLVAWTQPDSWISPKQWGGFTESFEPKEAGLSSVKMLKLFLELLKGQPMQPLRMEKLHLILENDMETIMIKEQGFCLREIIRDYLKDEGIVKQAGFGSVLDHFAYRILTGEGQDLGQMVIYKELWEQMVLMVQKSKGDWTLCLKGEKGLGKEFLAALTAREMKRSLLVVDGWKLENFKKETALYFSEKESREWFIQWELQVMLGGDIVYLRDVNAADRELMRESQHGIMFYAAEKEGRPEEGISKEVRVKIPMVTVEVPYPSAEEKGILWKYFMDKSSCEDGLDASILGSKYVLNAGGIKEALFAAECRAKSQQRTKISPQDLTWAVMQSQAGMLSAYAKQINSVFSWDDLIVEEETYTQLQCICAQVKYRHLVGNEWGLFGKMPYGRGLGALFYGPPGTGKTMAAQVLAGELGFDLYRVDLSQMVSKYIGETEKNISKLFEQARHMNVILLFDEADALFAKRSKVKDSNDRNANAQVAHLLQQMEDYDGISILATNLKDNLDEAFKRRIKFMVPFSFPTAQTRRKLWKSMIPDSMPLKETIDLDYFADNFELSGSQIKEILLNAAFMAAKQGNILGNRQLIEAVRLNYQKYGKFLTENDFGYLWDID